MSNNELGSDIWLVVNMTRKQVITFSFKNSQNGRLLSGDFVIYIVIINIRHKKIYWKDFHYSTLSSSSRRSCSWSSDVSNSSFLTVISPYTFSRAAVLPLFLASMWMKLLELGLSCDAKFLQIIITLIIYFIYFHDITVHWELWSTNCQKMSWTVGHQPL